MLKLPNSTVLSVAEVWKTTTAETLTKRGVRGVTPPTQKPAGSTAVYRDVGMSHAQVGLLYSQDSLPPLLLFIMHLTYTR